MERRNPIAMFMAFGTKGDVHPIAAIAAAFAGEFRNYAVIFVTHAAHQGLAVHLAEKGVSYDPVYSPPVLSATGHGESASSQGAFLFQKERVRKEHRQECFSIMERIFGDGFRAEHDFVVINLFALEGWSLAELFHVRCVVAAPYVVPYSAPSSFERQFVKELPLLHRYLLEAPVDKVSWNDVMHWLWPLFTEDWGSWRSNELNLSLFPFTDPVTGLPMWHDRPPSPLLLYGFSSEVVEYPPYWPSNVRVCGFWCLPRRWQFSCSKCRDIFDSNKSECQNIGNFFCSRHIDLGCFLQASKSLSLVFIGLSSIGSMGFLKNPQAFLHVLRTVLEMTKYRFILFTAGYEPLDAVIRIIAAEQGSLFDQQERSEDGICLFSGKLFSWSGSLPYSWLFQRCIVAIHHGGSGSTAAALHAGIPQVVCPFMLDQFYWAERMSWLGVAPEPLKTKYLLPEQSDDRSIKVGASMLLQAIDFALTPAVRARAKEISRSICLENGISETLRILHEVCCPVSDKSL